MGVISQMRSAGRSATAHSAARLLAGIRCTALLSLTFWQAATFVIYANWELLRAAERMGLIREMSQLGSAKGSAIIYM
jgi:hypothetical protein